MRKTKLITLSILLTLAMLGATANAQPAPMNPAPAMVPAGTPLPAPVAPIMRATDPAPAPAMTAPGSSPAPPSGAMAPAPAPAAPAMAPASPEPAKLAATPATVKTDSWWKVLIGGLLEILLVFVLAFAIICGRLLIKYIAKKMKVTNAEEIERMNALYDNAVTIGVNFATQQAHKLRDNPDSKGKRLDWAVEKAQELMREYKLPDKLATWVKDKIEAKIGETERKFGFAELVVGESVKTTEPKPD